MRRKSKKCFFIERLFDSPLPNLLPLERTCSDAPRGNAFSDALHHGTRERPNMNSHGDRGNKYFINVVWPVCFSPPLMGKAICVNTSVTE